MTNICNEIDNPEYDLLAGIVGFAVGAMFMGISMVWQAHADETTEVFFTPVGCTFTVVPLEGNPIDGGTVQKGEKRPIPSIGATAICVDTSPEDQTGRLILMYPHSQEK